MTYPQQQYQPQYPQQQVQPMQPYGQQYQQAQPTGGAALPAVAPPLATGGAGGGAWPKMRHLQDCTIIIEPVRVDETKIATLGAQKGQPQPEAYFHLTVVDSPTGKIQYGDSLDAAKPMPLAWERDVPCRFTNINDYGYGPVNEVRNALAAGESARVGVVERGTQGNRPYLITQPDKMVGGGDRPNGQQRFERASQVWAAVFGAQHGGPPFANPEPRSLLQAPAQAPQQVTYQQPPAGGAPSYPQGYGQYNAPQQPPAYNQQPAVYAPNPQGYQGPNGMQADPYSPKDLAQAFQPPANPAFEAWLATLPPDQQAQQRAALAAQATQQGPGL